MFREHIAVGAIISMVVVVGVYFYALVTDPLLLAILFGVTIIGSFLPDVDSDSGMPFYLIFGTATLAATGVVLLYTLSSHYAGDWRYLVGIPAAAMLLFWFVVGGIIKKCTHHRGIFHSLPAMLIAGAGALLVARQIGLDETTALVFGAAMAIGFASHLVMDELHSFVDLEGIPFIPKKSLGTALKMFSDSKGVNIAAYVLLAALVYTALQTPIASAYYNDSDVIEIGDAPPPEPEPEESGGGEEGGGGGTEGGEESGDSGGGDGSPGGDGGSGGGGGGGTSAGGGAGAGDGESTEDDVLETLLDSGAFEDAGGLNGASVLSGEGGFDSDGVLTVVGSKVREALSNRTDLQDILEGWRSVRGKGKLGAREYGLVAASTALRDSNVEEISFTASRFDITYRSRGYLIGLFPWSFPVRVAVVPQAPASERVTVTLPWYRFFVREFFTPARLSEDIESAMVAALAEASAAETDQNALLFSTVSQLLRDKVGTVGDSVVLGSSS